MAVVREIQGIGALGIAAAIGLTALLIGAAVSPALISAAAAVTAIVSAQATKVSRARSRMRPTTVDLRQACVTSTSQAASVAMSGSSR